MNIQEYTECMHKVWPDLDDEVNAFRAAWRGGPVEREAALKVMKVSSSTV